MTKIKEFFENFLKNNKQIFKNKKALQPNFIPETILHREEQIKRIAEIIAPALKLNKPSNLFIYGKTGSGKTVSVLYLINELNKIIIEKNINTKLIYINCKLRKVSDTEYRLIAQILQEFGKPVPPTGLPTDELYKLFFKILDEEKKIIVLVLDEIDHLVEKIGDEILYNLTRMNTELKNSQISIIGISNNLTFTEFLDPRVKSSLSEEEIIFPPYNALQIQDILYQRSKEAFVEGVLAPGLIEKCAAYSAREHGDARRAIELLRVAGELAERNGDEKVEITYLDAAEERIEHDRIMEAVSLLPKQSQVVLYAILSLNLQNKKKTYTGEIYEIYKNLSEELRLRPLTQRRVSDVISEFDILGIICAKVISKGRYGRMREISIAINKNIADKIKENLRKELGF